MTLYEQYRTLFKYLDQAGTDLVDEKEFPHPADGKPPVPADESMYVDTLGVFPNEKYKIFRRRGYQDFITALKKLPLPDNDRVNTGYWLATKLVELQLFTTLREVIEKRGYSPLADTGAVRRALQCGHVVIARYLAEKGFPLEKNDNYAYTAEGMRFVHEELKHDFDVDAVNMICRVWNADDKPGRITYLLDIHPEYAGKCLSIEEEWINLLVLRRFPKLVDREVLTRASQYHWLKTIAFCREHDETMTEEQFASFASLLHPEETEKYAAEIGVKINGNLGVLRKMFNQQGIDDDDDIPKIKAGIAYFLAKYPDFLKDVKGLKYGFAFARVLLLDYGIGNPEDVLSEELDLLGQGFDRGESYTTLTKAFTPYAERVPSIAEFLAEVKTMEADTEKRRTKYQNKSDSDGEENGEADLDFNEVFDLLLKKIFAAGAVYRGENGKEKVRREFVK